MERNIYTWNDGAKDRKSDPMVLVRRFHEALLALGIDYGSIRARLAAADMVKVDDESQQAQKDVLGGLQANGDLACIAFKVFDVQPLDDDGNGWTEAEASEKLGAFFLWQEELASKKNGCATSPASTEQTG